MPALRQSVKSAIQLLDVADVPATAPVARRKTLFKICARFALDRKTENQRLCVSSASVLFVRHCYYG